MVGRQLLGTPAPPSADARAEKPEVPSWVVDSIAETSKNASQIYVLYMSFLAYCVLTIFTTRDDGFLLNQAMNLPLLNVPVPSQVFFTLAPVIAIALFIHLQFYQCRFMALLSDSREHYAPMGRRRLYPWLITFAEEPEAGLVGSLQTMVVQSSLWWSLPMVLTLFAFWNLKRHIVALSIILAVLHIVGSLLVVYFWRRDRPGSASLARATLIVAVMCTEVAFLGVLFRLVKTGYPGGRDIDGRKYSWIATGARNLTAVDLSHLELKSPDLREVHLEGARLDNSKLDGVSFYHADLRGANLSASSLKTADMTGAHLERAQLYASDFTDAKLSAADFTDAYLPEAKLVGARLVSSVLRNANLIGTDFAGAVLVGTDFEGADLSKPINITGEQLAQACTLYGAKLEGHLLAYVQQNKASLLEKPLRGEDGLCHQRFE